MVKKSILTFSCLSIVSALAPANELMGRRQALIASTTLSSAGLVALTSSTIANAAPDCMTDCLKNCKIVAPKDPAYCKENCISYCAQTDRQDGLSGSVGSEAGYTGILGGTFGQGTVPKGDDKPPGVKIPGLDFTSQQGRKLIGY